MIARRVALVYMAVLCGQVSAGTPSDLDGLIDLHVHTDPDTTPRRILDLVQDVEFDRLADRGVLDEQLERMSRDNPAHLLGTNSRSGAQYDNRTRNEAQRP